ncbi:MAG: P-II family nitrogen regulator [Clostridia bacterium]|nr:P-II family nitrogen regulator [Clostridia bacterium]
MEINMSTNKKYNHEVIFCIVNAGFSDAVMDAAKEFGARGGTVIHARGTAGSEAEKLFSIAIQPEKEIVMILVNSEIRDDILHALYKAVGLNTPGQGIAFTMPVSAAVGLFDPSRAPKAHKTAVRDLPVSPSAEEKGEKVEGNKEIEEK